jgi:hypothetical protein
MRAHLVDSFAEPILELFLDLGRHLRRMQADLGQQNIMLCLFMWNFLLIKCVLSVSIHK